MPYIFLIFLIQQTFYIFLKKILDLFIIFFILNFLKWFFNTVFILCRVLVVFTIKVVFSVKNQTIC